MTDPAAGYDAGDHAHVSERQKRRRLQSQREDDDLVWLMNQREGRRFLWRLLLAFVKLSLLMIELAILVVLGVYYHYSRDLEGLEAGIGCIGGDRDRNDRRCRGACGHRRGRETP